MEQSSPRGSRERLDDFVYIEELDRGSRAEHRPPPHHSGGATPPPPPPVGVDEPGSEPDLPSLEHALVTGCGYRGAWVRYK